MTTTPDGPRPDEAPEPIVDRGAEQPATPEAVAPDAGDTQPIEGTPAPGDPQPVRANDTAPSPVAPPAPVAPAAPATAVPATPPTAPATSYPAAGYHPPYPGQPYAGPAYPAPQPPYPPAQPSYPPAQPSYPPAQQYGYGARPFGTERPYGAPYTAPQQPYAQHPYAAAPGGTVPPPGAPGPGGLTPRPRRRRAWLPVVATLVAVVLLAAAAVLTATHPWRTVSAAGPGGPQPTSIATIGQGGSGTVPVSGSTVANPNWPAVAAAVQGSVVAIDVQTSSGEALGSGVVVDDKGHIVTNNHVVAGVQGGTVQVTLSDGRLYDATITGTDASTDLAVVTLKNPPSDLTVAQFGNSNDVRVGDPVMAVGNPLGLANTVTTGIVSAINRPVSPQSDTGTQSGAVTNAIQIDAAINPGNSGGPLFNVQGQVIGITSSIATTSSSSGSIGLGFAIPVDLVSNIAQQIIANGSAKHAYLGVTLQDGQATADGVTRRGARVMSVTANSPASAAGLQAGDVVVAINGQPVGSSDSLAAFVRAMSAGDKASLVLVRDGTSLRVEVTLAAKADTSSGTPTQNPQGAPSNQNGGSRPGNLQNMTPQQLWQWLQQQQGRSSTPGGSSQG